MYLLINVSDHDRHQTPGMGTSKSTHYDSRGPDRRPYLLFMFRKVHTLLKDVMSPIDSLYNHDSHVYIYIYTYIFTYIYIYYIYMYVSSNNSSRHWKILPTSVAHLHIKWQQMWTVNSSLILLRTRGNLMDAANAATSYDRRICVKRSWRCVWKVLVSVMGDQLDLRGFSSWSWKHGGQKHRLAEEKSFVCDFKTLRQIC